MPVRSSRSSRDRGAALVMLTLLMIPFILPLVGLSIYGGLVYFT